MNIKFEIKDGILLGPYPDGAEIELADIKKMISERIEFLNGNKVPALVDITGVKKVSKEARDYMATSQASEGIVAAAILSKSMFSTFLCNFFIKVSLIKAPIPIKQFTNESEALLWLKQYI